MMAVRTPGSLIQPVIREAFDTASCLGFRQLAPAGISIQVIRQNQLS